MSPLSLLFLLLTALSPTCSEYCPLLPPPLPHPAHAWPQVLHETSHFPYLLDLSSWLWVWPWLCLATKSLCNFRPAMLVCKLHSNSFSFFGILARAGSSESLDSLLCLPTCSSGRHSLLPAGLLGAGVTDSWPNFCSVSDAVSLTQTVSCLRAGNTPPHPPSLYPSNSPSGFAYTITCCINGEWLLPRESLKDQGGGPQAGAVWRMSPCFRSYWVFLSRTLWTMKTRTIMV